MNRAKIFLFLCGFLAIYGACEYSYRWIDYKKMDDEENRVLAILDSYSLEIPHTFEYAPEETVDVYDYVVHTPFESEESVKVLADDETIELDMPKEGEINLSLSVVDSYDRVYSKQLNSFYEVIDTNKPVIELKDSTFTVYKNGDYRVSDWVESVVDSIDGDIERCNDDEEQDFCWRIEGDLDVKKTGTYQMYVVAEDKNHNLSSKPFTVKVKERPVGGGKASYVDFDRYFTIVDGHQAEIDAGYLVRFFGDYWHHNWASFMNVFWQLGNGTTVKLDGRLWTCRGIEKCWSDNATQIVNGAGHNIAFDGGTEIVTCATNDGTYRWVAYLDPQ